MKPIRPRMRLLFVAFTLAVLVPVLSLVYVVTLRDLRRDLEGVIDATRTTLLLQDFTETFVVAGVIAALLAAAAAFAFGALLVQPLARLRAVALATARGEHYPATASSPIVEYHNLFSAIDRVSGEAAERLVSLTRERAELAMLVSFVSEGILQLSSDGRVVRVNPAARVLLGIPYDAAGQPLAGLVRHAELRSLVDRAAAGERLPATELTLDDRRLLVSARPITGVAADDAVAGDGSVVSFVDLTEVRRLEGVRRDFVANVSHELKTPLTSIRGYVETLLSDDLPDSMRSQFLEVIQKNAERLHGIVDDLLDLSRLESGGWRPELTELDALAFAQHVWSVSAARAEQKNIAFSTHGAAATVLADPAGLDQVLTNLYDNALRYTPPGGHIRVRVAHEPPPTGQRPRNGKARRDTVLIEVQDSGSGIPRDALPRIFERFYRVDPARSRAEGGTGLGLSIVKHLMESMGGSVTAESELGKGTTIRLRLAAARTFAQPAARLPA